jgi:hypothetical protein
LRAQFAVKDGKFNDANGKKVLATDFLTRIARIYANCFNAKTPSAKSRGEEGLPETGWQNKVAI